jgi:hypothetical protein
MAFAIIVRCVAITLSHNDGALFGSTCADGTGGKPVMDTVFGKPLG